MRRNFTEKEKTIARRMAENGSSMPEIAEALNRSYNSIAIWMKRHNVRSHTIRSATSVPHYRLNEEKLEEERQVIYNKFRNREMRWLTLNDLHYPFQSQAVIDHAMQEEDIFGVILSEVWDFYGLSRFKKDRLISAVDELHGGLDLIRKLKKRFGNVVWFEANHERRIWKMLQDRLADKPDVLELLFINNQPPVAQELRRLGVYTTHSWWARIGKVIFAHPDWFSNLVLRTAENTQEYFLKEDAQLWANTNAIVNAHTHHIGMSVKFGQTIIETGCGCNRMDYLREGRKRIETHHGYALIQIEKDGSFNWNESRLVRV